MKTLRAVSIAILGSILICFALRLIGLTNGTLMNFGPALHDGRRVRLIAGLMVCCVLLCGVIVRFCRKKDMTPCSLILP